jgi:hypothetical protein
MAPTITFEQRKLVFRLRMLRRAIRVFNMPAIQPAHGLTWCNVALHKYALLWGHTAFEGKTANEISAAIEGSTEWQAVTPAEGCAFANTGRLVVAYQQGTPHGHVAAVLPLEENPSDALPWSAVPVLFMGSTPIIGLPARFVFKVNPEFAVFAPLNGGYPIAL